MSQPEQPFDPAGLDPALRPPHPDFRSGMAAVVGRANVGKSSLVNALLGEKVSIVSPVAQTTRNLVRGVLTEPRGQLVFLDTPGVHKARHELGRLMNKTARSAIEGVDAVLFVMDGDAPPEQEDEGWMRRLAREPLPALFVLNKCDRGTACHAAYRERWARVAAEIPRESPPTWLETSATTGNGTTGLLERLFALLPRGPLLFPEDVLTDFPRKLAVADVIREKYFARLTGEVPHCLAVWVDDIREDGDRWSVFAKVYVQRASQKGIIIGNKGRLLKSVKHEATLDLADMFDRRIDLDILVTVQKGWDKNFWILRQLGYR